MGTRRRGRGREQHRRPAFGEALEPEAKVLPLARRHRQYHSMRRRRAGVSLSQPRHVTVLGTVASVAKGTLRLRGGEGPQRGGDETGPGPAILSTEDAAGGASESSDSESEAGCDSGAVAAAARAGRRVGRWEPPLPPR